MEMEKRVLALEYQIKILKNEIQRLLLQVQENILIHYYPALEKEEYSPKASPKMPKNMADDPETAVAATAPPEPIKMKTLEEPKKQPADAPQTDESQEPTANPEADSQDTLMELSEWASTSVASIGADRTRKLIESCEAKGWLEPKTRDLLLRLVSMNRDSESPEIVAVNQVLGHALKVTRLIGAKIEIEEVLTLIEEAGLG
ncbi:MAG: hypothetical protein JXA42_04625 [Anaerolineales bacterium]|nr:hypothetical protein [Anaerolineales bacterium]